MLLSRAAGYDAAVKIELLYFDGCAGHDALLARVTAVLAETGTEAELELRRVETEAAARAERFLGSPTLRIDGVDVDPGAAGRSDYGLTCRLYRTPEGPSPTPPDEWLWAALARARRQDAGPA